MLKRAFEALKSPVTAGVNEKEDDEAICVDETGVDIAEALEILKSGENLENKDLSEKEIRVFDTEDGKETIERETKRTEEIKHVTKPVEESKHVTKPIEETKHVTIKKPHFDVETIHSPTVGDLAKVVEKFIQNNHNGEKCIDGGNNLLDFLHAELSKQSAKQPLRKRSLARPPKHIKDNVRLAIARGKQRLSQDFVINKLMLPQTNTPSKNETFNEQIKKLTSSNCKKSKLSFEEYFSIERENEICLYFSAIFDKPNFQSEVTAVVSIRKFIILIIDKTDESNQLFQVSITDIKYIQILDNLQEVRIISSLAALPLCFPTRKICGDFLCSVEYLIRLKTPIRERLLLHLPPGPLLTKPIIQSFLVSIRSTNPGLALQRVGTFMYSIPVNTSNTSRSSLIATPTDHSTIAVSTDATTNSIPIDAKSKKKWRPGNFFVKAGALYVFGVEENLLPVISQKLLPERCSVLLESSSFERPHIVEVVLQEQTILHVATSEDDQAAWFLNKMNNAANFVQEDIATGELVRCHLVISSLEFGCFINNASNDSLEFGCFINNASNDTLKFGYFVNNAYNHKDEVIDCSHNDNTKTITSNDRRASNNGSFGDKGIGEIDYASKNQPNCNGGVHFIWRILCSNIQHLNLDKNHCLAKILMREDSGCEDVSVTFPGLEELAAFHSIVMDLNVTVLATKLQKGL